MLKMPIGLYEKALPPEMSWEERLAAAGQAGFDFMEISIDESEQRLSRLDWSPSQKAALRHSIANTGVKIMSMCLSGHRKYPLGSVDANTRKRGLEILYKAIEFASDVGLRVVQVMGYDVFYEESDDRTRDYFMEGLSTGVKFANQAGVMLGLENLDTPFVENLKQGLAIVHEINSPWLNLYPDIGNLCAAGYHPPEELTLAIDHVIGLHIKDAMPKVIRGIEFNQGIVPFQQTFKTLAELGFWGFLGVEIWGDRHDNGDPITAAASARQFVDGLVSKESWCTDRLPVSHGLIS